MSIVNLNPEAGKYGIVKGINPTLLAQEAWSDGTNVRMQHGSIYSDPGFTSLLSPTASWPIFDGIKVPAFYKMHGYLTSTGTVAYILASSAYVGVYINGKLYDITRLSGIYQGPAFSAWNITTFGGLAVLNNGIDMPQAWMSPGGLNLLTDIPGWPINERVKVLRAFGNYLVGLDWNIGGIRKPFDVRWSASADPGTMPVSWNIADPSNDAGEYPMSAEGGALVDMCVLGHRNIIYTETSIWSMTPIGYPYIFSFQKLFSTIGLLAQDCVVAFQHKHFVVTNSDIIVHDGNTWESIIEGKMRKWLFVNMDPANTKKNFCVNHSVMKEIWFFFVSLRGAIAPDMVLIWNWESNTFSFIDLGVLPIYAAIEFPYTTAYNDTTFDDITTSFDTTPGTQVIPVLPMQKRLIAAANLPMLEIANLLVEFE